jgi:hypothetical protein
MTTPNEILKQRRRQAILHELAEPLSTEAYFIGVAEKCVAVSGAKTPAERDEIFRESYERMMSAWMNDESDELLDRIEASPSIGVAATRKNRRKEDDIDRFISVAKKLGM